MSTRLIVKYDHYLLTCYIVLMIFGLIMQLNISSVRASMLFFYKQALWFLLSLGSLWLAFKVIDLQKLRRFIFLLVIITIILLILVLLTGEQVKGGVRSIRFLGVSVQPSLIARLVLVLYFAHILDKKKDYLTTSRPLGFLLNFNALIVIPVIMYGLILAQHHFTPLIISSLTLLSLLYLASIRFSTIALILLLIALGGFLIIQFGPSYRGERMDIYARYSLFHKLADKQSDYQGTRDYQIRESLISLGSGGLLGTGSHRGTGKHYFLPEAKTDYIFAIIGEEYGFLGALLVLGLFVFLFIRTAINSSNVESLYLKLLSLGLGLNIFYNVMVNVGVAISALPSTGVTLPFISYGGTSLLINSFAVGLLLNVSAERRII